LISDLEAGRVNVKNMSLTEFATDMIADATPYSNFARTVIKRTNDPVRRDLEADPNLEGLQKAWDLLKNKWLDSLGLSDAPEQYNILGEVVALPPGAGPDIVSPFYTSAP